MNLDEIKISIIIPIYNQEKYLRTCLDSIKKQNFSDFEVIMVNDGSEDSSEKICTEYLGDSRFSLILQENSGVSIARNKGIENAKGEWIAFVDPDDYLSSDYLTRLYRENDGDTDIIGCCCKAFDENGIYDDYFYSENFRAKSHDEKEKLFLQLLCGEYGQTGCVYTAFGVPWGKLYRKDFLTENALYFNPKLKRMQDNIFNMYAFEVANVIKYVNEGLYYYRLEHINGFLKKYNNIWLDNNAEIRKERYLFFEKRREMWSDSIMNYYYDEGVSDISLVIGAQFMHPEINSNFREFVNNINRLVHNKYFDYIIKGANTRKIQGKKKKLILGLLRYKMYFVIYLLYRIKHIMNKIENEKIKVQTRKKSKKILTDRQG